MTKKKLLELLESLPDTAQIYLYNGLVDDHMDISGIQKVMLVKEDKKWIRDCIVGERIRDNLPPLTDEDLDAIIKRHKFEWDYPNEFVPLKQYEEWYGTARKYVHLINAKLRNKTHEDRVGKIYY